MVDLPRGGALAARLPEEVPILVELLHLRAEVVRQQDRSVPRIGVDPARIVQGIAGEAATKAYLPQELPAGTELLDPEVPRIAHQNVATGVDTDALRVVEAGRGGELRRGGYLEQRGPRRVEDLGAEGRHVADPQIPVAVEGGLTSSVLELTDWG